ncbi:unnamed protein product [Victoria cruziana]
MWRFSSASAASSSSSSIFLTANLRAMLSPSTISSNPFDAVRLRTISLFRSAYSYSSSSHFVSSLLVIRCRACVSSYYRTLPAFRHRGFFSSLNFQSFARGVSASSFSGSEVEWKEHDSSGEIIGDEDDYRELLLEVQQENQGRFIPVNAFFLCTSVDLKSLQSHNAPNVIPPSSRASNYVVLKYPTAKPSPNGLDNDSSYCYVVVFQYGSVVLFNAADHEIEGFLGIVRTHASGLLTDMRKDDYAVVEKPALETWMQEGLDYIVLKTLNVDGVRTIGSVLGQSVALDYYVRQVDGMVAEFTDINREMEKSGTFTMQRKKLFQLVGKANSNLADVILKLKLLERSDIAWKSANYAQIWEYLRDEYELTQRFGSLDFKLKFVEHNIRFLQEILQNRKSDFLEWIIILLISVEILISLYNIMREQTITPS